MPILTENFKICLNAWILTNTAFMKDKNFCVSNIYKMKMYVRNDNLSKCLLLQERSLSMNQINNKILPQMQGKEGLLTENKIEKTNSPVLSHNMKILSG